MSSTHAVILCPCCLISSSSRSTALTMSISTRQAREHDGFRGPHQLNPVPQRPRRDRPGDDRESLGRHDYVPTQHNSYVSNGGTWFVRAWDPVRLAQQNGVFLRFGSIGVASITDGMSNTIGLGERALGVVSAGGSLVVQLVGERLFRRHDLHIALPHVRHSPDARRVARRDRQ